MNTAQVNTEDSQSMAPNHIRYGLIKASPPPTPKAMYFLPMSNWGQDYVLKFFRPKYIPLMCDQPHRVQLGKTKLVYLACYLA